MHKGGLDIANLFKSARKLANLARDPLKDLSKKGVDKLIDIVAGEGKRRMTKQLAPAKNPRVKVMNQSAGRASVSSGGRAVVNRVSGGRATIRKKK
jgi:hypothetical protein